MSDRPYTWGDTWDALVVGAGPAGATLAIALSRIGYRVGLVSRSVHKHHHVGESVPGSLTALLDDLGLPDLSEAACARPPEHAVSWGTAEPQWISYEESGGLLVWRDLFDGALRDRARACGVELLEGAATAVRRRGSKGGFTVRYRAGSREGIARARLLADCSGRAGLVARRFRTKSPEVATLALTGHWRLPRVDARAPTLIETFADGWVWSAPSRGGVRDVTVMTDAASARGGATKAYVAAVENAPHVRALLEGASLLDRPRGYDATPFTSRRFAGPDFVLVGDAASALDPLSSHGVHKAMDSALTAASVARTLLERPESPEPAIQFYESRESQLVEVTSRRAGEFYALERRWADRPFWSRRSVSSSTSAGLSTLQENYPPVPKSLLHAGDRLRPAPSARVVDAPVLESEWIEMRPVLVSGSETRGVRFWESVVLPDLFQLVIHSPSVEDAARRSPLGRETAGKGIEWLYRAGFLEHER